MADPVLIPGQAVFTPVDGGEGGGELTWTDPDLNAWTAPADGDWTKPE